MSAATALQWVTAGAYHVQFVATFGAANDKTLAELWEVEAAI